MYSVASGNLANELPVAYKKSTLFFRSLYSYTRQLPSYSLVRKVRQGSQHHQAFCMVYRLSTSRMASPDQAGLGTQK